MTGIYGWSTGTGGVHHYRMAEPLRVAGDHGIRVGWGNRLDDEICEQFDTILVHMLWQPHASEAWQKLATNDRHRMIFDIDDVMWSPDYQPFQEHYSQGVLAQVYRNIQLAHIVTTPSTYIAEVVSTINPNVWYVPNTVPEYLTRVRMPPRPAPVSTIGQVKYLVGYQGSPSHVHDFPRWFWRDLLRFLDWHHDWGLHIWGADETRLHPRIGHTPWASSVRDYYMSLSMDVGIGPLKPSPFNAGKSGLRAIEYAALGIPAILSAGPAYDPWVRDMETGFLVRHDDPKRWLECLNYLASQPEMAERMGAAARASATQWTTEANIGTWAEAWNSVSV